MEKNVHVNRITVKENEVYVATRVVTEDSVYRSVKNDYLSTIYKKEGQYGLDREILLAVIENHIELRGSRRSVSRYYYGLENKENKEFIKELQKNYSGLSDTDEKYKEYIEKRDTIIEVLVNCCKEIDLLNPELNDDDRGDCIIWDDEKNYDEESHRFIKQQYVDYDIEMRDNYGEEDGIYSIDEAPDEIVWDCIEDSLRCARHDLDIEIPNGILEIFTLDLGPKLVEGFCKSDFYTIGSCLYEDDEVMYLVNENDDLEMIRWYEGKMNHHIFREWKPKVSEEEKVGFRWLMYTDMDTPELLAKYTQPLGERIKAVYNWK